MAGIFIAAGLLSACSTSDMLTVSSTPPATVGAAAPQAYQTPPPVAETATSRQNLATPASAGGPAGAATYVQQTATAYDTTPGRGRPPSTFGQQAQQLGQTQQAGVATPAAQVASQPAPQVAASPQQAASPTPVAAPQQTAALTAMAQPAATPQTASAQTTPVTIIQSVRFLPIIGAPSDKLEPLSARLGDSVRAAGLTIVPMDQATADLSLKGYFSVVNQNGVVSVVYVWDVIGPDGLRLHRIQGSEPSTDTGFSGTDPWDGVTPAMMADIGQKSVGSLLAWLDSQG
nr:hypothetical protein [Marinicella sp. W31]MDC2876036.1 hypothetical protein [Marinicella sp. W31]